jgi:ribose transport system ATP-binding protein
MSAALEIARLSKTFGGAKALDDVTLTVLPGEVHGLLGQNGSGKSTLIKILAGYHDPEPGAELTIFGRPARLPLLPGEFRKLGLAFVHQQLGLMPTLSVVENLRIGELATRDNWRLSWARERRRAREVFARFGLAIDPDERIADLPQVERALVAIVRAFEDIRESRVKRGGAGILILDEPTPFLPRAGIDRLFDLVRQIAREGASVLFVSHDVDEVMEITNRATVLRDGRVAGTLVTADSTPADFVEMIIGRRMRPFAPRDRDLSDQSAEVTISGLTGGSLRNVAITLRRGEALGLTGLIGSGFDEALSLLFGATRAEGGRLMIGGADYDLTAMTPTMARAAGIALLPADRLGASGVGRLSVSHNATLPVIDSFMRGLWLDRRAVARRAMELCKAYDVRPADPTLNLEDLSGGNQQKVLLAKWLQTKPALLMLDEPTQGVDVGARQQVYEALDAAAKQGASILCASTDAEQLAAICHRVLIFSRGRIAHELKGADVSKEQIAEQCYKSSGIDETRMAGGGRWA